MREPVSALVLLPKHGWNRWADFGLVSVYESDSNQMTAARVLRRRLPRRPRNLSHLIRHLIPEVGPNCR